MVFMSPNYHAKLAGQLRSEHHALIDVSGLEYRCFVSLSEYVSSMHACKPIKGGPSFEAKQPCKFRNEDSQAGVVLAVYAAGPKLYTINPTARF